MRGRKRNDNLPPNRNREVQRAFRARRAAHLEYLEKRITELLEENKSLRQELDLATETRLPGQSVPGKPELGHVSQLVGVISTSPESPRITSLTSQDIPTSSLQSRLSPGDVDGEEWGQTRQIQSPRPLIPSPYTLPPMKTHEPRSHQSRLSSVSPSRSMSPGISYIPIGRDLSGSPESPRTTSFTSQDRTTLSLPPRLAPIDLDLEEWAQTRQLQSPRRHISSPYTLPPMKTYDPHSYELRLSPVSPSRSLSPSTSYIPLPNYSHSAHQSSADYDWNSDQYSQTSTYIFPDVGRSNRSEFEDF